MNKTRIAVFAYGLLMPAILVVALLLVYPLYLALNASFRQGKTMNFSQINKLPLTFENYTRLLTDPTIWKNLWVSVEYTVASTAVAFLIGLVTALLLNQSFIGRRWIRTLILLPWAVPGVAVSLGFVWLLDASYGIFNFILRSLGFISSNIAWLSDPKYALIAVILPTIWKGYPFFTLMLLAALQSIPPDLYEAGRVDGAAKWRLFTNITWPGIKTTAILSVVLNGLWAFREFDFIYSMTKGGPMGATETLATRIYTEAFSFFNQSSASALGIMTFLLCIVTVMTIYPLIKEEFFGGAK